MAATGRSIDSVHLHEQEGKYQAAGRSKNYDGTKLEHGGKPADSKAANQRHEHSD